LPERRGPAADGPRRVCRLPRRHDPRQLWRGRSVSGTIAAGTAPVASAAVIGVRAPPPIGWREYEFKRIPAAPNAVVVGANMNRRLTILSLGAIVIVAVGLLLAACGGNYEPVNNPDTAPGSGVPSGGDGSETGSGGVPWNTTVSFTAFPAPIQITVAAPEVDPAIRTSADRKAVSCQVTFTNSAPAGTDVFETQISNFWMHDTDGYSYDAGVSTLGTLTNVRVPPGQTEAGTIVWDMPVGQTPAYVRFVETYLSPSIMIWGQ
jgi:hypothetical protein